MIHFSKKIAVYTMLVFAGAMLVSSCASTKQASKDTKAETTKQKPKKKGKYKPYDEVITDKAVTDKGLFAVHKVGDKFYYEIPDSLLNVQMLLVSRIAGTPQNLSFGGAGMKAHAQQVLRWQKQDDKILLRHVSYESIADQDDPIYKSVQNNNFEPVVYSFDIEAIGKDSTTKVIDVTKLFTTDVPLLSGLSDGQRKQFQVRRLDGDRSYIKSIHSYPRNIEVRHILTYVSNKPPANAATGTISLAMNQSMIVLPKQPMQKRLADERVGYFSIQQYKYGSKEQKAVKENYIVRYKLIPKDKEAYLRGELVEPVNPIVYYVDPATPEEWRPYIKKGIEDWQKAFEAAGFKNAIIAKDPPTKEEDPEFSPEDVRYSVVRYITNTIQNAQGPNVHDPRTGQILESDVLWYHNVMNLLRNWYFVQTAAANPEARHVKMSTETMGNLIRFVSSHEIGHTLGLPHNWGSSYAYPVDSLRSPTFTSTHGTAPSIMDYARFNYIAQPGDGVTNFHPAIGEYDKWAIKWGYTWFPDSVSPEERRERLNQWTIDRADDPRYFYGAQSGSKIDPRSQNEDLGNDAMKAGEYGIANLKRIEANLMDWTYQKGSNYDDLSELHGQIIAQWNRYMGHVLHYIGGVYEDDKTFDQKGAVYTFVPKERQKKAMEFLNDYAFTTQSWLLDQDVLSRTNQSTSVDDMRAVQVRILNDVLDPQRIARLIEFDARYDKETYTAFEMMDDLRNGLWSELSDNRPINVHRRNLQRAYLERMHYLLTEELPDIPAAFRKFIGWTSVNVSQSDIRPIVRDQLQILLKDVKRARGRAKDRATRVHLVDVQHRIEKILNPDK